MTLKEVIAVADNKCPDCGGKLTEGPHGGCSVNMLCYGCGSKFNTLDPEIGIDPKNLADSAFCERLSKMSPETITQMKELYP